MRRPYSFGEPLHLLGDERRLVLLVVRLVDDDGAAGAVLRPEVLLLALLVEGDDAVGGIQDRLGGAVVLIQDDHRGVREIVLEVEDVADVGGAPGIDRLVGVADDADVAVTARPLLRQDVLRDVRVLELIDVDVLVALGVLLQHLLALLEQLHRLVEDIVEVEGGVLLQDVLVAEEYARGHLLEVVGDEGGELARPLELALGAGDGGEDRPGGYALGVQRQVLHRPLDGGDLVGVVVDGEGAGDADLLAVNAVGDDAGLAGAGPGDDQQRPFGALNGLPLAGVEGSEDVRRGDCHATRMIQVFGWAREGADGGTGPRSGPRVGLRAVQSQVPEREQARAHELAHDGQRDLRRNDPVRRYEDEAHGDEHRYAGVNRQEPGRREAAQAATPHPQGDIGPQRGDEQKSDEGGFHRFNGTARGRVPFGVADARPLRPLHDPWAGPAPDSFAAGVMAPSGSSRRSE